MSSVEGINFCQNIVAFAKKHKVLCILGLGLTIVTCSRGNLAGRVISWICECMGTAKKANDVSSTNISSALNHDSSPKQGSNSAVNTAMPSGVPSDVFVGAPVLNVTNQNITKKPSANISDPVRIASTELAEASPIPSILDSETQSTAEAVNQLSWMISSQTPNIDVTIHPEVKNTLDQLFLGSPYAIDNLPNYPSILNALDHGAPKREVMTASIMKGVIDDGCLFIAIKVDCNLRDEDIEKLRLNKAFRSYFNTHRKLEDIIFLYQRYCNRPLYNGGQGEFVWRQIADDLMNPVFFTDDFIDSADGTGPIESQTNNFKLVQTLLKEGQSKDTRGLIWHVST